MDRHREAVEQARDNVNRHAYPVILGEDGSDFDRLADMAKANLEAATEFYAAVFAYRMANALEGQPF